MPFKLYKQPVQKMDDELNTSEKKILKQIGTALEKSEEPEIEVDANAFSVGEFTETKFSGTRFKKSLTAAGYTIVRLGPGIFRIGIPDIDEEE